MATLCHTGQQPAQTQKATSKAQCNKEGSGRESGQIQYSCLNSPRQKNVDFLWGLSRSWTKKLKDYAGLAEIETMSVENMPAESDRIAT